MLLSSSYFLFPEKINITYFAETISTKTKKEHLDSVLKRSSPEYIQKKKTKKSSPKGAS
tara:strand:- start:213 stop:389 length:177 start_codon:yes stop_codon:yes gene_type:complete